MIIPGIVETLKSMYLNRSTQELLATWKKKSKLDDPWTSGSDENITEEGFEAIRQILVERGIEVQNQAFAVTPKSDEAQVARTGIDLIEGAKKDGRGHRVNEGTQQIYIGIALTALATYNNEFKDPTMFLHIVILTLCLSYSLIAPRFFGVYKAFAIIFFVGIVIGFFLEPNITFSDAIKMPSSAIIHLIKGSLGLFSLWTLSMMRGGVILNIIVTIFQQPRV